MTLKFHIEGVPETLSMALGHSLKAMGLRDFELSFVPANIQTPARTNGTIRMYLQESTEVQYQANGPIRIGELIDYINKTIVFKTQKSDRFVRIGPAVLDTYTCEWTHQGKTVRLTEKETAMVVLMAKDRTRDFSREEILKTIWAYADTVETHTLETHVYRLRQKIEPDPSNPVFFVTVPSGYRIGF